MTVARLLALLAVAAAAQGCVVVSKPTFLGIDRSVMPRCAKGGNPNDCYVDVVLKEGTDKEGRPNCSLTVQSDQETITFRNRASERDRFIYWVLDGAKGYTFRADGIFIPGNRGEFDLFKVSPNDGLTYRVRNRNPGPGKHKYWVNVVKEIHGIDVIQCSLDPFIHNE